MTGYPDMVAMWRLVPVTRNFFIVTTVIVPFGADPNMMITRPVGSFDHMLMRPFSYIIVLGAGAKRGQG
jgi:hypothetical protein